MTVSGSRSSSERAELARRLGEALLDVLDDALARSRSQALPAGAPAQPAPEPLLFLGLAEVGRRLHLSRTSVEALLRQGGPLTPIKQGRSVSVSSDELLAYQHGKFAEAGGALPGEASPPIDIGRPRQRRPAAAMKGRHRVGDKEALGR